MEKFADLQYVRPDMEKVFARVSGDIAALKKAKSYEEHSCNSLKAPIE